MSALSKLDSKPNLSRLFQQQQVRTQPQQRVQPSAQRSQQRLQLFSRDTFERGTGARTPSMDAARRTNPMSQRYLRRRDGTTFCNQYTQDYLRNRGLQRGQFPQGMVANQMHRWFGSAEGQRQGWRQVSAAEAQRHVNAGGVGVASWYNNTPRRGRPDGRAPGHVAPIVEGNLRGGQPTISNAGRTNFMEGSVAQGFGRRQPTYWIRG
jgi:hypothetical protein